jgi:hypothetical protein
MGLSFLTDSISSFRPFASPVFRSFQTGVDWDEGHDQVDCLSNRKPDFFNAPSMGILRAFRV